MDEERFMALQTAYFNCFRCHSALMAAQVKDLKSEIELMALLKKDFIGDDDAVEVVGDFIFDVARMHHTSEDILNFLFVLLDKLQKLWQANIYKSLLDYLRAPRVKTDIGISKFLNALDKHVLGRSN